VRLVAVGELARDLLVGAPGETWFATVEECLAALPETVPAGSAVLVKASRLLRLERVAQALEGAGDA
jgi:UDP-N-acetylmuramyl pentapeptide synthase